MSTEFDLTNQGLMSPITEMVIKSVARDVSKHAVKETLETLGFDMDDPVEIQKDIAAIRTWRKTMEKVQARGFMSALTLAALGILALIIVALKSKLGFLA